MLIGLLSDTHIPETGRTLPPGVKEIFQGVELILHAGDIYIPSVLDELEEIAPVVAALGDDDTLRDRRVKEQHILSLDGLRLGLVHRFQGFYFLWSVERGMQSQFGTTELDVVVFGDTHSALVKEHQGVLLVNPGSPLLPNYFYRLGSVALLEIKDGQAQARIVELK